MDRDHSTEMSDVKTGPHRIRNPEQALRLEGQCLARMSHEMRTPVNGIIGMIDLLLDSGLTPQQAAFAQTANDCADSVLQLVNDILDFAKIDAGKLEFAVLDFDLESVIRKALAMVRPQASRKGIALACRTAPGTPTRLRGDPGRLGQVLANLASNAVKFTDQGMVTIDVACERRSRQLATLRFSVQDTGIGIPEDHMGDLFEPFTQAHPASAQRRGGTGLGLAITKQLVEMMNGRIGAESAFGRGSTFWFVVVLGCRDAGTHESQTQPPEPQDPVSAIERQLLGQRPRLDLVPSGPPQGRKESP